MKHLPKIVKVTVAAIFIGVVGIIALFLIFDYPYPSTSLGHTWEKNYRNNVTNEISDFHGHWLDADIGAYIYSYKHTSSSIAAHQAKLIKSLNDYQVIERTEKELVLRRSVTYSRPDGFDEWHFLFDHDTKLVTVLFANLDSEIATHADLVKRERQYHQKRKGEAEGGHVSKKQK
jgi:hypothetical protein